MYYDYFYVFYMLDIGQRAIELMLHVYCHTDDNKDYLFIYLSSLIVNVLGIMNAPVACLYT